MGKTVKKIKAEGDFQNKKTSKPILLPALDARVAEIGYYKAKNRGFSPGQELDGWLEIEKELNF